MNFYFLKILRTYLTSYLLILFLAISGYVNGQGIKDLYYAQPENTGLYLGFVYLNENQFVLAGLHSLYLLNNEKVITDTLVFGKHGLEDNIYIFNLEDPDKDILVVATLKRSLQVQVLGNHFKVLKETPVKSKLKVGKLKVNLLIPWGDKYVARAKLKHQRYFLVDIEEGEIILKDTIFDDALKFEPTFIGAEVINFNSFQSREEHCFLYDKRTKKLIIYNRVTGKTRVNNMPEITYDEFVEFYIDPISGKSYLFKFDTNNNGILYNYDWQENKYSTLLETKYLVRGVFDGKVYVSGVFDGTYAHYLIPIKGSNKNIILIDGHR